MVIESLNQTSKMVLLCFGIAGMRGNTKEARLFPLKFMRDISKEVDVKLARLSFTMDT
jgi:hypothetical protein